MLSKCAYHVKHPCRTPQELRSWPLMCTRQRCPAGGRAWSWGVCQRRRATHCKLLRAATPAGLSLGPAKVHTHVRVVTLHSVLEHRRKVQCPSADRYRYRYTLQK